MTIVWKDSADKHGVPREDALHAMLNPSLYVEHFDDPRVPGASRPDLWIGPPRQLGGPLLEIMGERVPPREVVVFHVMIARAKHLARIEESE